jgi:hypothetical protein
VKIVAAPPSAPTALALTLTHDRATALSVIDRFLDEVHRTITTRRLVRRMMIVETSISRAATLDPILTAISTRLHLFRMHWPTPPGAYEWDYNRYCADLDQLVCVDLPRLREALLTQELGKQRSRLPRFQV